MLAKSPRPKHNIFEFDPFLGNVLIFLGFYDRRILVSSQLKRFANHVKTMSPEVNVWQKGDSVYQTDVLCIEANELIKMIPGFFMNKSVVILFNDKSILSGLIQRLRMANKLRNITHKSFYVMPSFDYPVQCFSGSRDLIKQYYLKSQNTFLGRLKAKIKSWVYMPNVWVVSP